MKKKEEAYFVDTYKLDEAERELVYLQQTAQQILDVWQRQEVLPDFTADTLDALLERQSAYLDECFTLAIQKIVDATVKQGLGKFLTKSLEAQFSRITFNRLCGSFIEAEKKTAASRYMLEIKAGKVTISQQKHAELQDMYTAFTTEQNVRLYEAGMKAVEALKELKNILDIDVLNNSAGVFSSTTDDIFFNKKLLQLGK